MEFNSIIPTLSKETENSLYIVQEYLDGKTLTQLIKTVEMEEAHIKQIIIELLNAVSYLHSQDIIHRDIKPDNIIITTEGQLKLIDFGLSSHSESKLSYDKCGTLLFMAPEMIFKQPYLKSVDIAFAHKNIHIYMTKMFQYNLYKWDQSSIQIFYQTKISLRVKEIKVNLPLSYL